MCYIISLLYFNNDTFVNCNISQFYLKLIYLSINIIINKNNDLLPL